MSRTRRVLLTLCLVSVAGSGFALASEAPAPAAPAGESDVDVVPPQIILKTQKAPEFPPAAFEARFSGEVAVEFTVLADGTVDEDVRVLECTHKKVGFEEATIAAIRQWRFRPATKDGQPVEYTKSYRLTFHGSGTGAEIGPYVTAGAASSAATSGEGSTTASNPPDPPTAKSPH
jgi:TonB family protein